MRSLSCWFTPDRRHAPGVSVLCSILALAAITAAGCASASAAPRATRGAQAPATGPSGPPGVLDEIDEIVRKDFFSPARLAEVAWSASVARARRELARARDDEARAAILRALLGTLEVSHTGYYRRADPEYWALAGIFEPMLQHMCDQGSAPSYPVEHDDIGVFWKKIGASWFAAGIFAGSPAEAAGLLAGDEVVTADGQPFSPVLAFAGKDGAQVSLQVRRARGGPLMTVSVTPRRVRPQQAFRDAVANSWRVIDQGGKRIAYIRIWSWTSDEIQQAVSNAIIQSNREGVDGYVLDLRDGWGGADPSYLGMFSRHVPVLESVDRSGQVFLSDRQLRAPAVLLVNEGTRSGKEVIAYGARKHGLARVVGERTAGAVIAGRPYCLRDGSLLYLAVMDVRVDGERLEGRGVQPEIEVRFDIRHAAGKDPQLDRALELLVGK